MKLFKKRYLLIAAIVPFVLLNGCSIGGEKENKSIPITKIDMSRYEKQTVEGEFKGILNKKFVDVEYNGSFKTFYATEGVMEQLEHLKAGDKISFIYSLSQKTGQNELNAIVSINGQVLKPVVAKEKPVKGELNQKQTVKKVDMEVDYPGTTKIVKAVSCEFLNGHFNAIDSYEWDGEKLTKEETEIRFTEIKDTIEDDVQKERWRAADILNEFGDFKEVESDNDDVKFTFNVKSDEKYKEIMVIKNKGNYYRIEIDTKLEGKDDVISEVNAMLNTIE